jgi:hypothetical protein
MSKGIYRIEIEDNDIDISPTIEEILGKSFGSDKINAELLEIEEIETEEELEKVEE